MTSKASVTVGGMRRGNVKVTLNSNQVKSLQAGVHADTGGLYLAVRGSGDRVWAFRFTDLEGKRAIPYSLSSPVAERLLANNNCEAEKPRS